jgi:transcriptional regulator with XRE-family HTH domain
MNTAQSPRTAAESMSGGFAAKLYRHMTAKGLSQAQLARKAGLTRDNISKYLRGSVREPTDANLEKLAAALGISRDELWNPSQVKRGGLYQTAHRDPVGKVLMELQRHVSLPTYLKVVEVINAEISHARPAPDGE